MGDAWKDWEDPDPFKHWQPGDITEPIVVTLKVGNGGTSSLTLHLNPDGSVTWKKLYARPSYIKGT